MSFLRRLLGGERGGGASGGPGDDPAGPAGDEAEERALERELAREEAERLDELQRRQLRFAAYAWKPADQGGSRRADEADSEDPGPP